MLGEVIRTLEDASSVAERLGADVASKLVPLLKTNLPAKVRDMVEGQNGDSIYSMLDYLDALPVGAIRDRGDEAIFGASPGAAAAPGEEDLSSRFGARPAGGVALPGQGGAPVETQTPEFTPRDSQSEIQRVAASTKNDLSRVMRETQEEESAAPIYEGRLDFKELKRKENFQESLSSGVSSDDRYYQSLLEQSTHSPREDVTGAISLKEDILMGTSTKPLYDSKSKFRDEPTKESADWGDWKNLVDDNPIKGMDAADLASALTRM